MSIIKTSAEQFQTPILFLIFNRPDTTQKVFEKIREIKPGQLFIAADGPRYPLKNEVSLCEQTRTIALQVDWPCEVKTLFQDKNFGVGRGGVEGINWFFEHVEAGIILEDDCVPTEDFFYFCQSMLKKYAFDESVMMISGTSYLMGTYQGIASHYSSKFYAIWGWATWRRAWRLYDFAMTDWRTKIHEKDLLVFWKNKRIVKKWVSIFDAIIEHRLEAWDAQWIFACVKNGAGAVATPFNMISNIGLWGGHANGRRSPSHEMPLQHFDIEEATKTLLPASRARQFDMETYRINNYLYHDPAWRKCGRFIKRLLLKMLHVVSNSGA